MIELINLISGKFIKLFVWIIFKIIPTYKNEYKTLKRAINSNKEKVEISKNLLNAIIEIEDKRYYEHIGVDFYSIVRAIYKNIAGNRIEGASTITQQLVRNILNEREITIKRKINEIILATLIDSTFSKKDIMMAYLNTYKFNSGIIGISTLCLVENYRIKNLSDFEVAQIAARLKYPVIDRVNYLKYLKRVRIIETRNPKLM